MSEEILWCSKFEMIIDDYLQNFINPSCVNRVGCENCSEAHIRDDAE